MNKLSNILGKPVISLYNGQVEGTILNAVFDKKLKKIYAEFDKQDINPITLPNSSSIAEMPPLNKLL